MVRDSLAQAGLDAERLGTPLWNPLGELVRPGSSVFVLCNFVYHRRPTETVASFFGKCIHASVLRAVLDYVLLAVGPRGRVAFGNAPLQSCSWDEVLKEVGATAVLDFYKRKGCEVEARDLRSKVVKWTYLGRTVETQLRDVATECAEVDLGTTSLLSEFDRNGNSPRFGVTDYDLRRTAAFQSEENHRYVISRAIVDADAVISISKLKTHNKVGITCGLKGYVGVVGHKDCLAHYRVGSPSAGGDEYPDQSPFAHALSQLHNSVWGRRHSKLGQGALQVLYRSACRASALGDTIKGGGWYRNDTAWRMALDLARIVRALDKAGHMSDSVQRSTISFIDGIVGGEGDGPLSPTPVNTGLMVFSPDVAIGDLVACRLMGFDPNSFPLIREAFRAMKYPVTESEPSGCTVIFDGKKLSEAEVGPALSRAFLAPQGWSDYLSAAEQDRGQR
jgi:uncharacterized protein (DUF362 family)